LDRASNPVQFYYKFTPGVKDDEGTWNLTVEIPTGEKTFVSFGAEYERWKGEIQGDVGISVLKI